MQILHNARQFEEGGFIVSYSHGFQLICSKARLDQCKCKEIKGAAPWICLKDKTLV